MKVNNEHFTTFITGDIKLKDNYDIEEIKELLEDLEDLFIRHNVLKLDVSIDIFNYPKDLL